MSETSWKFFVLARDKRPLANCNRCQIPHDPDVCQCLTCHGFYAATDDDVKLRLMASMNPNNPWAVRTGKSSGIVVIDVDGEEGLKTLDEWESWTGFELVDASTVAQTPSGGLHLYYRYPIGVDRIPSRSRVLPGVDIKADDAYVVIPTQNDERRFWKKSDGLSVIPSQLLFWLQTASGKGASGSGIALEYDFNEFVKHGCPDGYRDDFFNKLAFGYRKANFGYNQALARVYEHWLRCAQPIEFQTDQSCGEARWYMPWKDALYKLDRVYRTVKQDENRHPLMHDAYVQHLKDLGVTISESALTNHQDQGQNRQPTHPRRRKIIFPGSQK